MMKKRWELTKRGSYRCLHGIWDAAWVTGGIEVLAWVAPRLINLLATEPVQLRDPASSVILVCKMCIIGWAFMVGLGTPE